MGTTRWLYPHPNLLGPVTTASEGPTHMASSTSGVNRKDSGIGDEDISP